MSILTKIQEKSDSRIPEKLNEVFRVSDEVILGKSEQIRLAISCLLAEGHLLIEDVPGMGKTTLVKFLSKALGLTTSRIQFTNDLLPADIIGTSIFNEKEKNFYFHKGPIFSQVVIGDELNRATPKTQSACLQAMEERQVSVDGTTHELPNPFFFIATQNPKEQSGTFPLPESQLDRFLMRIEIGYPDREAEKTLLKGELRSDLISHLKPLLTTDDLLEYQSAVKQIHVSDKIVDFVQNILDQSRGAAVDHYGLSPRCGLALLHSAKAWAFIHGRDMVLPEDVQAVAVCVIGHRLNRSDDINAQRGVELAREILAHVQAD